MRDFKTLTVWQKAHQLVLAIYKATAAFPKEEMYGLTSQIRRAASSIPANIAKDAAEPEMPKLTSFIRKLKADG